MAENTVTLREYIEKQFEMRDREVAVARREMERRLDAMNELRSQIENERGRYITRELYDTRHDDVLEMLNGVHSRLAALEGGNNIRAATIGWLLAGLGLFISVIVVIINLLTQ